MLCGFILSHDVLHSGAKATAKSYHVTQPLAIAIALISDLYRRTDEPATGYANEMPAAAQQASARAGNR